MVWRIRVAEQTRCKGEALPRPLCAHGSSGANQAKRSLLVSEFVESSFGLGGWDLANVDVAEANLRTVGLQPDGACRDNRGGAIEEVVKHLTIHRQLAVEPDPHARPDHLDPEGVPLADRLIGLYQGPLARVLG